MKLLVLNYVILDGVLKIKNEIIEKLYEVLMNI